ncbi:PREDICTED: mitogen-activated protein kinase kinase kinase 1-like [Fragaria vesca subsp. vesca]|uniref:mitogen-activated protein kinase kinase kinase 1-like n=1 Tax=Fragaria vesca subsp. vesca TaxID=101020 RepID=UPI0002C3654F|nr:PREDICTED: mitogen-activated protein kinase kinase kinase 1-like [Fragaria vesca subsp. vesca]
MDAAKQKRPKPRLDRRNALKNIDYDADQHSPTPRTRSLDLSPLSHNQTSFRVRGIEGEFDLICRSLGLSGPEDLAIPLAAWEAQRPRSSSDFTSRSRLHNTQNDAVSNPRVATEPGAAMKTGGGGGGGGGIRGLRPPPVVLKSFPPPPPPQDRINSPVSAGDVTSSDEEEPVTSANGGGGRSEVRLGKGNDLAESVSCGLSPSNNDSDDYGVGIAVRVEPIHSIFSPNGKFRRSVSSSWQRGHLLGSGSYGTVYEGFTDDGFFFAVKEVSLLDQGAQGKQSLLQLEQEIHLLSQFEHDNIVQYLGTDKDETKLYIFLELVTKGSLASLYSKYVLRDSQVSVFTRQILSGLIYLHDRNVLHRDIKCANILVDASGSVKLADFGLAKATKLNDVKSCKGSAYWMAPEVVNRRNRGYGLAADIWSLGCAVLEMLTRQPPYSHLEGMQALFQIGSGQPPVVPDFLSRDARDFILKCLQVNPNNRPTAAQLLNHSFLKRPQTSSFPASPHSNSLRS